MPGPRPAEASVTAEPLMKLLGMALTRVKSGKDRLTLVRSNGFGLVKRKRARE